MQKASIWFEKLPKSIAEQAINNLSITGKDKKYPSLKIALGEAFFWSMTPEGHTYWKDIFHQIKDNHLNFLGVVAEFHTTFKSPILPTPQIPDEGRTALRVSLLQEELDEFKEGIANKDIVEIADALCDLQYVLSGAILEFGLGDKFPELFAEVHRSNMSKACTTHGEAVKTCGAYQAKDGTLSYIVSDQGKHIVYRIADHKTLKSINYSPADLKSIIES